MNIIFLINSPYPNYTGGIENWLYNVSTRLSEKHEVSIISHYDHRDSLYYPNITDKIKLYQYKTLNSYSFFQPFIRSYLVLIDFFIRAYAMGKKLKTLIDPTKMYYIVALDSMFCVKAELLAKSKNNNIFLIASVRGPHAEILSEQFPLFTKIILNYEKKMLQKVDQIWSNGYDTMDQLKIKGFNSKLVKNGIDYLSLVNREVEDVEFERLVKNKITIVNVGTLLPIKGIYELIDALFLIKDKFNSNVHLIFIGKGSKENFANYAKKKNLYDKVHFLGHRNNPALYVKKCTISACLSGGSGMSMAAIESMVSNIPIIAWNTPIYRQFNRNKQTMVLVEKNVNALAEGITDIIENYQKYEIITKNATKEAMKYDWELICNDIIKKLQNDQ